MDVCFSPDAVLGTNVCTDENDDYVNVYANYDLECGTLCDTLDVILWRGDDSRVELKYRLSDAEKEVLRFPYPAAVELTLRGSGHVRVELRLDAPDNPPLCQGETVLTGGWETPSIPMPIVTAAHAVYFAFAPAQPPQFERFAFSM